MKRLRYTNWSANKGFTLVEILIVAALIALFSGMAIISTSYMVQQSKRKSAVADARTLASVLSISHMNLGFFPKLGYLSLALTQIQYRQTQTIEEAPKLPPDFDVIGFDSPSIHASRVFEAWGGPYYPSSASRKSLTGGKGYSVRMQMPTNAVNGEPVIVDWPADPWGSPYVVYLLSNKSDGLGWVTSPFMKPDYFAAVVSYGPDGIPGSPANGILSPDIRKKADDYKLYRKQGEMFYALAPEEYNRNRLLALRMSDPDFGYMGQGVAYGIQDPGSDDIIVPIP
jgi:prepilin-type N-terminal cleavage/methylation domain-containing protein